MTAVILHHPSFVQSQVEQTAEKKSEFAQFLACSTRDLKLRIQIMTEYLTYPAGHSYAVPPQERPGVAKLLAAYQFELQRRDQVDQEKRQRFQENREIKNRFLRKKANFKQKIQSQPVYFGA